MIQKNSALLSIFILGAFLAGFGGCAHGKPAAVVVVDSQPVENTSSVSTASSPAPQPQSGGSPLSEASTNDSGSLERSDLKVYDRVTIRLPQADVILLGNHPGKRGKISIHRLHGDTSCRVFVAESESELVISDMPQPPVLSTSIKEKLSSVSKAKSSMPPLPNCHFGIELSLHEAAELSFETRKGSFFAEHWDEPIRMKMDWGDIDVGSVGELNVECGRCTIAGENITGALRYKIDAGNVGVSGLSDSVEGQTLGDTILKWHRITPKSSVKLTSRAGDVLLFFPGAVPINADLKAPRGEVKDGPEKGELRASFRSGVGGVPVTVMAELGNVRLYRMGKNKEP